MAPATTGRDDVIAGLLAETPLHALPWYFGVSVFVVWAGAALAGCWLVRRRIRARAQRRRDERQGRRSRPLARDDIALGPGAEIEPW